jgi:hypothetical protein
MRFQSKRRVLSIELEAIYKKTKNSANFLLLQLYTLTIKLLQQWVTYCLLLA